MGIYGVLFIAYTIIIVIVHVPDIPKNILKLNNIVINFFDLINSIFGGHETLFLWALNMVIFLWMYIPYRRESKKPQPRRQPTGGAKESKPTLKEPKKPPTQVTQHPGPPNCQIRK